ERRRKHARMRVRDAHQFEQALHAAVFAPAAMQRVEHGIGPGGDELLFQMLRRIDLDHVETFVTQGLRAALAGDEAHLAFRGTSAQQHGHTLETRHATPTRLISHSSSTPNFAFTRARTSSPKASMSAAVASPVLIRKLQCFSETCAPPWLSPRQPA